MRIGESSTTVQIRLLDVPVAVHCRLNEGEHARRSGYGYPTVTDADLLARLEELPLRQRIHEPVLWAETSHVPAGAVARHDDMTVTRLLDTPLHLDHIVVECPRPRDEIRSVQQASLFARFTRRWVTMTWRPHDATMLEASFLGVGIAVAPDDLVVAASDPAPNRVDGWAWCLAEKTYSQMLHSRAGASGGQLCR